MNSVGTKPHMITRAFYISSMIQRFRECKTSLSFMEYPVMTTYHKQTNMSEQFAKVVLLQAFGETIAHHFSFHIHSYTKYSVSVSLNILAVDNECHIIA